MSNKKKLMWGAIILALLLMMGIAISQLGNEPIEPNNPPQVSDNGENPAITDNPSVVPPIKDSGEDEEQTQNPNEDQTQVQDPNEDQNQTQSPGTSTTPPKGEEEDPGSTTTQPPGTGNPSEGENSDKITIGKVTNLTGTVDGTSIKLTWNKADNATGYEIYIQATGGDYFLCGTTTSNSNTITGLKPGTTAHIKVRGYAVGKDNATVYGEFSDVAEFVIPEGTKPEDITNVKPGTVANLKGTATYKTVTLTWDAVKDASAYEVYRKVGDNSYERAGTVKGNTITISGFTPGSTVTFKVRAYTLNGDKVTYGDYSKEVSITLKKVNKVEKVKSSDVTSTSVKLSWDKVANAKGYEIYQRQKDGTYKLIKTVTTNSAVITGLNADTTYYFRVRAYVEEAGIKVYGDFSEILKVTTIVNSGGDDDNQGGDDDNQGGGDDPGTTDPPDIGGDDPGTTDPPDIGGDDQGGGDNNQGGSTGDNQGGNTGENQGGNTGDNNDDNQGDNTGDNQGGSTGENQGGNTGENQGGNQGGNNGENQGGNQQGGDQGGSTGENQGGNTGENQGGNTGENSGGNTGGDAGGGQGDENSDSGGSKGDGQTGGENEGGNTGENSGGNTGGNKAPAVTGQDSENDNGNSSGDIQQGGDHENDYSNGGENHENEGGNITPVEYAPPLTTTGQGTDNSAGAIQDTSSDRKENEGGNVEQSAPPINDDQDEQGEGESSGFDQDGSGAEHQAA